MTDSIIERDDAVRKQLFKAAKANGLYADEKGYGHFQIRGGQRLVNYYPFSKRQTAFVEGTTKGVPYCSIKDALKMAGPRAGTPNVDPAWSGIDANHSTPPWD